MSAATQITSGGEKRPPNRLERLLAADPQFRDSFPLETVVAAKREPGLRSGSGCANRHGGLHR